MPLPHPGWVFGYSPGAMLIAADSTGFTLALLATFLGIGVIVNLLIIYAVAQVMSEHRQNRRSQALDD